MHMKTFKATIASTSPIKTTPMKKATPQKATPKKTARATNLTTPGPQHPPKNYKEQHKATMASTMPRKIASSLKNYAQISTPKKSPTKLAPRKKLPSQNITSTP